MIVYRALAAMIWLGVVVAFGTVVVAAGLVAALGAVIYGLASPSRTPKSALRSLHANTSAAVEHVKSLR